MARASPIPPRSAKKLARETMPSRYTPDVFQGKTGSQKAVGSRRNAKNTRNNLVHVPKVPLSYVVVRASRRGGRLRPLSAISTKETSTPAKDLCIWCTNRFHRLNPKYYGFVKDRRTYKDTHKSAQGGCHICSLLIAGITAVFGQKEEENWNIETTLVMGADNLEFTVMFQMTDPETGHEQNFQFCSPQGNSSFKSSTAYVTVDHCFMPTPLDSLVFPTEVVAETRVDECVNIANQWISTCHESHPACQQQQLSRLPTRVIDVGSDHQQDCPKLLECDGKADRYIALSHCWGSGRHFTTETTNLDERMKGMRWESLPKTFQDAISVTRKLGIRYLWIDSLCILQDDSADWDKELSKMSDIYKNSFLTIAAVSAEDDQAGFLGSKLWHVPIALPPLLNFSSGVKIWQGMDYRASGSTKQPLKTRAWAFQERLISQRVLSFGSKQMIWECNSSTRSEVSEARFPPGSCTDENRGLRELYDKTLRLGEHLPHKSRETITPVGSSEETARVLEPNHSQLYHWWRKHIITTYAKLYITKEEDRLPALSAIANEVHLHIQDTYLAGLWKRDLLLGLLWLATEPGYLPYKYRAPSWSWASIEASPESKALGSTGSSILGYEGDSIMESQSEFTAQIIQAECEVSGISKMGEVTGGFIRLSTRWFHATLHITAVSDMKTKYRIKFSLADLPAYDAPRSEFFFPDVPLIVEAASSPGDNNVLEGSVRRSTFSTGHAHSSSSGTVSCIMIATLDSGYVAFMVLGGASSPTGVFERLGIFKIHRLFLTEGWYDFLNVGEFLIV